MKFAAVITYSEDNEAIRSTRQEHHNYLKRVLDNGQLLAAGPMSDDHGALWVLETDSLEDAQVIIQADPYCAAGVFAAWQFYQLMYWSAKALKGV